MTAPTTEIDTSLLLNKNKKKAQFIYLNYICFLYEPTEILNLSLEL